MRAVTRLQRQAANRIEQLAPPHARQRRHRHGGERRPVGRRSDRSDSAPRGEGERDGAVDRGRLALVGRHAERGVALDVLDRQIGFARRERDILHRHVALQIDPRPPARLHVRPGGRGGERVFALAERAPGGAVAAQRGDRGAALRQRAGEREDAVGRADDGEPVHRGAGNEGEQPLVPDGAALGLAIELDGRVEAAGNQQGVRLDRRAAGEAHGADGAAALGARDAFAASHLNACRCGRLHARRGRAAIDDRHRRAGLA